MKPLKGCTFVTIAGLCVACSTAAPGAPRKQMTGVFEGLPDGAITSRYSAGPLLGNGEVGATISGTPETQTIHVNRVDFWTLALGGVDISADRGPDAESYRYKQHLADARIRSVVTINGNLTEMEAWVAADSPVLVTRLTNRSPRTVGYRISTWTKSNRVSSGPMHLWCYGSALPCTPHDAGDHVFFGSNKHMATAGWFFEPAGKDTVRIRNASTGHYMHADKGDPAVYCTKTTPDESCLWNLKKTWGTMLVVTNARSGAALVAADAVNAPVVHKEVANWRPAAWSPDPANGSFHPDQAGNDGKLTWSTRQGTNGTLKMRATLVSRILDTDKITVEDATQSVSLEPGGSVTLVTAVDGDGRLPDDIKPMDHYLQAGKERVMTLNREEIERLAEDHRRWWREFWSKSQVDLGDDLLNGYWDGAFYALACCSRAGNPCPGLWGAWNTTDARVWKGSYTCNYNFQSPFYGIYSGNHVELGLPYYDAVLYHLPHARHRAQAAGYPGVMYRRGMGMPGTEGPPPARIAPAAKKNRKRLKNDQLDAPAFNALNFINHYRYTLDKTFLQEKAWPVMLACAEFYEDYLVFEKATSPDGLRSSGGRYVFDRSAAREGGGDTNPCYPLAYIKLLLQACVDVADEMGIEPERRRKWEHIIEHMSAYPTQTVNGRTIFKEAESLQKPVLDGPGDNSSLLQTIHPGEGINLGSAPALIETARNTIDYLNSDPEKLSWDQMNNFPQIFTQAARVGWDAEDLFQRLKSRIGNEMRPNLTVHQGGGGIETSGATEAIHSMLLQGHEGVLRLFPVWPKTRGASFTTLRARGAFLVSSELKGGEVQSVQITSEKGSPCTMVNPWPGSKVVLTNKGKTVTLEGERLTFQTKPGQHYELAKGD